MAQLNLNTGIVKQFPVALPPFNEQKHIVAKVDQLMALCDELEKQKEKRDKKRISLNSASLNKLLTSTEKTEFNKNWNHITRNFDLLYSVPENVQQLKQAILQLAVMGKLVPQNPKDEPASVLLEKIKKEKERLIEKGKIKKSRSQDKIISENCNWNTPVTWERIELQDLFNFIDYRGKTPKKSNNGKRLITAKNIRMGYIQNSPIEYVSDEYYEKWMVRGFPQIGDILFVTEGHTMGFAARINMKYEFALAQRTICFQPILTIDTNFFLIVLMSTQFQNIIIDNRTGSAAGGIKASKLKRIPIPLPSLSVQTRIVNKVNQLIDLCDELEKKIIESELKTEKIINAIVNQL